MKITINGAVVGLRSAANPPQYIARIQPDSGADIVEIAIPPDEYKRLWDNTKLLPAAATITIESPCASTP